MSTQRFSALLGLVALAACDNPSGPLPPSSLTAVGSTAIELMAGEQGVDSVVVRVVDSRNRGVPNVQVAWSGGVEGIAEPTDLLTITDDSGLTGTQLIVGTRSGIASVTANIVIEGATRSVVFDVAVMPGPAVRVEMDTLVRMPVSETRSVVLLAYDQFENEISEPAVEWSSSKATVAEVSGGTVSSKSLGVATLTAQVGAVTATADVWVIPSTISACEWNTGKVCSTWTLNSAGIYDVTADDGGTAWHEIIRYTDTQIEVHRTDWGMNEDFTGHYVGTISGRTASGGVTWTERGWSWSGTWSAEW